MAAQKKILQVIICLIVLFNAVQSIAVYGHKKKDETGKEAMVSGTMVS